MNLPTEQVLEAAEFFLNKFRGAEQPDIDASALAGPLIDEPMRHIRQNADLARLLLLYGLQEEQYREAVERAVQGSGQKQNIITDQNIVPLALAAIAALYIILRFQHPDKRYKEEDGKKKLEFEVTYKIDPAIKSLIDTIRKLIKK